MNSDLNYTKIIQEKTTYLYHTIGLDNCIIKTNFSTIQPEVFKDKKHEMMYDTLSFGYANKEKYESLDEFMRAFDFQDELIHGSEEQEIIKKWENYPFLKEKLGFDEFNEMKSLIIKEYFNMKTEYFLDASWKFTEGLFYFNEPSVTLIGVEFDNVYWGLLWEPYI